MFFDCLSGSVSGTVYSNLPTDSTMFVYGAMSNDLKIPIDTDFVNIYSRTIRGYHCEYDFAFLCNLEDYRADIEFLVENFHHLGSEEKVFSPSQCSEMEAFYLHKGDVRVLLQF